MFSFLKNLILRVDRMLRSQSGGDWALLATWRCAFALAMLAVVTFAGVLILPIISAVVDFLVRILIHPAMIGVYLLVATGLAIAFYRRWVPSLETDDSLDVESNPDSDFV